MRPSNSITSTGVGFGLGAGGGVGASVEGGTEGGATEGAQLMLPEARSRTATITSGNLCIFGLLISSYLPSPNPPSWATQLLPHR